MASATPDPPSLRCQQRDKDCDQQRKPSASHLRGAVKSVGSGAKAPGTAMRLWRAAVAVMSAMKGQWAFV